MNTGDSTITYTATDANGKTDIHTYPLTFTVTYNGNTTEYRYGDPCKLTADILSDWSVNGKLRAEGTTNFYFSVTENTEVTATASPLSEQIAKIDVLSSTTGNKTFTYVVSWSLPEGAQVKSTMIYRCRDDAFARKTAEALLAAGSSLRSYNMNLNVRNGHFTFNVSNLTASSHQTVMAQVVYTLNGQTHTIHTEPTNIGPFNG